VDIERLTVLSPASQLPELAAGHQLDRYELICPVAQGGMASVWLARLRGKHGFEKLVALKTILPELAEDKRFRRMFLDEARIAARIEHVNVAQTLDLGEQDRHLYLVMEWVDGDSLSKLDRALEKAGQSMPLPILLRVMLEACAGLHAAHELCHADGTPLGVVHRDVSPQNILVSVKGQTKLIDFGIAKAQSGPSEETRAGILKGKLNYMPPEQAQRKTVDRRTDVWAVGAVLYRMLTRRTPYESPSPVTSLRLLTSLSPPAPLPQHVEPGLAALVMHALSPRPEDRPGTARELQAMLEQVAPANGGISSTEELASFVSAHLGGALQDRRDQITHALRSATERDTAAEPLSRGTAATSGIQDTVVDRRPAALDPDTGALNPSVSSTAVTLQMSSRAPEAPARRRWLGALGAVALLAALLWGLSSLSSGSSAPTDAATPKSAAAPPAAESLLESAKAAAAPDLESPTPASATSLETSESLPPPVLPSALPLSEPTPRPGKASAPVAPRPKKKPAPKRKQVDDGF
jgi:serine/threonine-protein kinase